jgi:hypothetical protein
MLMSGLNFKEKIQPNGLGVRIATDPSAFAAVRAY